MLRPKTLINSEQYLLWRGERFDSLSDIYADEIFAGEKFDLLGDCVIRNNICFGGRKV